MGKLHLPNIDFEKEKNNYLAHNGITLEELINEFQLVTEQNSKTSEVYRTIQILLSHEFFLTKEYANLPHLCLFVRQLLTGDISGDLSSFSTLLRAYDYSERCGVVWTYNYYAYRCRTCGLSVSMSLCEDCFTAGNHKGHDYNKFRSCAGGACDCGDVNVLSPEGFCPHHGPDKASCRPSPPPDLKFRMRTLLCPLLEGLLVCLWSMAGPHFFTLTEDIESPMTVIPPVENSLAVPHTQSAFLPHHSLGLKGHDLTNSTHSGNTSIQSYGSTYEQKAIYFKARDNYTADMHCESWKKLRCVFDFLQQLHAMGWLAQDVISSILLDKQEFQQFKTDVDNSVVYKLYLHAMTLFREIIQRKVMPADCLQHVCLMDTYIFSLLPLNFPEELTVLLIGLLTIADYKHAFMYSFVDHYTRIAMLLLKHYHEPKLFEYYIIPCPILMKDRIVHISVQLFSGESWAYELVETRRLHYVIASCLLVCFDDCCKYLSQHRVISLNKKFLYDTGFWPMVSDFINIVSHESVVYYICQDYRFLQFWFQIIKRLQYSDINHRRDTHVQRERDHVKYLTSYTLELELSDNTMWNMWVHLVKPHNADACERYFKNLLAVIYRHLMQFQGLKLLFHTNIRNPGSVPISPAPTETANVTFVGTIDQGQENQMESFSDEEALDTDNLDMEENDDIQDEMNDFVLNVNEVNPEEAALFFTLQQVTLLGENEGMDQSQSSTLPATELPQSTSYPWHDVLTFHLPLFRQSALFWSVLHVSHQVSINSLHQMFISCFHGGVATGTTEVVSFDELLEVWLKLWARTVLGAAEVASNLWVYNGLEIRRTLSFYRDPRYAHSLSDLDILGVQMLSSCLSSDRILQVLRHNRCLLYGFDWEPLLYYNHLNLSPEKVVEVIQNWLFTVLLLLDTRTFWTKSEKGGCIRKELICCLAPRSRKRSDLSDRMPELPGLNQPFGMESDPTADSLLNEVATYTPPYHDKHTGALHSGVYSIQPSVLVNEFDALFQLMRCPDRREYSLALQNFFKACGQEMKMENTNNLWPPLHFPPPFPPGMQSLEDVLLEDSFFSMLFRMLFWYLHPSCKIITDEALNYITHLLRRCIFRGMEKADVISQCTGNKSLPWSHHPLRFLSRKRHISAREALPRVPQQKDAFSSKEDFRDKESICSLLIKTHACLISSVTTPKFTSETVIVYRAPCSVGRCASGPLPRVPYRQFQSHFIGTGAQHVSRLLDLMYWTHDELSNRICKSLVYLGIPEGEVYHALLDDKNAAPHLLDSPHSPVSSSVNESLTPATCSTPSGMLDVSGSQEKDAEVKKQLAKERQKRILERMAEQQKQFALKIANQHGGIMDEELESQVTGTEVDKTFTCIVTCAICQVDVDVTQGDLNNEVQVLSRRFINSFFDLYRSNPGIRELNSIFLANVQSSPPIDTRLGRIFQLIESHKRTISTDSWNIEAMDVVSKEGTSSPLPPLEFLLSYNNIANQPTSTDASPSRPLPASGSYLSGSSMSVTKQLLQRATDTSRLREALHRVPPLSTLTEAGSLNSMAHDMLQVSASSHVLSQLSTTREASLHPGSPLNGMFPHVRSHAVWYNCGHYAHAACFERYQAHVMHQSRMNTFLQENHKFDLVCPLCRRPVTWNSAMAETPRICHPLEIVWLACQPWGAPHPSERLHKISFFSYGEEAPTTCDVFEAYFLTLRPLVQQVERELTCILLYPDELSRVKKQCAWMELVFGCYYTLGEFLNKRCDKFPLLSILYALDRQDPTHLRELINTFVPGTSLLSLDPVDIFIFSLISDIPAKRTFYRSLERAYSLAILRSLYVILLQLSATQRQNWLKRKGSKQLKQLEYLVVEILEFIESKDTAFSPVEYIPSNALQIDNSTAVFESIQFYLQYLLLRLLRVAAQFISHGRWYPHWCDYLEDPKYLPDSSSIQVARLPILLTEKTASEWREEDVLNGEMLLQKEVNVDNVKQEFEYLVNYLHIVDERDVSMDPLQLLIVDIPRLFQQLPVLVKPLLDFEKKDVLMALSIGSELFPPRLVSLPATFDEIFLPLHRLHCPRNKHSSLEYSFLCLHCGHLVCCVCTVPCTNILEEDQPLAEIFQHAIDCCGHWGVYLDVSTSIVWAVHAGEVARWGAVHLDAFGEEDISLLRGKPLYLNQARYTLLEKQWICTDFRNILKHWTHQIPTLTNSIYA